MFASNEELGLPDPASVRQQLAKVFESDPFRQSERQVRFLGYLVEEELAGRGERLSQFAIASDVFDRDAAFDPATDSIVRVEARRLRTKLSEYYALARAAANVDITLPKGTYRVRLSWSDQSGSAANSTTVGQGEHAAFTDQIIDTGKDQGKPTVAVLPLDNMTGDTSEDYFSDGMTEDIITDLSKVSGLSVISRHSTFVYKNRTASAQDISEDLGARYLVEGSVRRHDRRIRITAQLIDAAKDIHLWAERYDRDLNDMFEVQDEVTRLIVEALDVKLTAAECQRLGINRTNNQGAHDFLLKAVEQFYAFTHDGIASALELLCNATERDPDYAGAHAWHGRVLVYSAVSGLSQSPAETISDAVDVARTAADLDPLSAHGHAVLGWALLWNGQSDEALKETQRAVELDCNFADGYLWRAMALASCGDAKRSIDMIEQAIRLNPHYSVTYLHVVGLANFANASYEDVLMECRRAAQRSPNFLPGHLLEAATLGYLGRVEEASATITKISQLDPHRASIVPNFYSDRPLRTRYNEGLQAAGLTYSHNQ